MTSFIMDWWNLVMDHEKNPLSNIKDLRGEGGEHE